MKPILDAIRRDGDDALLSYARELDGLGNQSLRVNQEDLERAERAMRPAVKNAVEAAIANIRQFAEAQLPKERFEEFSAGRKLGVDRAAVGCRRLLCTFGTLPSPLYFAHDGSARTNRRRESHLRHFASAFR